MSSPLYTIALDFIRHELDAGWDAEAIVRSRAGHVKPARSDDQPAIWLTVGGTVYPTREG